MDRLRDRHQFAISLCHVAGVEALSYFKDRGNLSVDQKGTQDWVSEADRNVELLIRARLAEAWPEDGIYGEEHDPTPGTSGFDWVIDPIDGTTNFVNGIPSWTIVLAGVVAGQTEVGVIHDPNVGETFAALRGAGAYLNDAKMHVAAGTALSSGSVSVGYSNRVEATNVIPVLTDVIGHGAMYHRNASGALSIAYVAAGRLLGYMEEHMNAWDCLAGQLLVEEAGGKVELQDANDMIRDGGRVVLGTPDVFDTLVDIADSAWSD